MIAFVKFVDKQTWVFF